MNEIVYNYYSIHGGFSSLATFIDGQNLFGWCSIARESTLSWSWSLEFWTSSTGGLNYVGLEETRRVITIFPWNFSKKRRVYYTFRHIHIPTIIPNLWVCGKLCEGIPWFSHSFSDRCFHRFPIKVGSRKHSASRSCAGVKVMSSSLSSWRLMEKCWVRSTWKKRLPTNGKDGFLMV